MQSTNHEVTIANLTNLQFAQQLLQDSPDAAKVMLGIGQEEADFISDLNPSEMSKLAAADCILFSFRFKKTSISQLKNFISGDPLALTHLHFTAARETLLETGVAK